MFLKAEILKKLMKEAYKKSGLAVANTGERIYIAGSYWEMDILKKFLPKTILAQIIELAGELPEEGTRFLATKDGNQMEIGKREEVVVDGDAVQLTVTNLIILSEYGVAQRVLQNPFGKIVLINNIAICMVSGQVIEKEKGECEPIGPLYAFQKGVFWANNWVRFRYVERTVDNEDAELISNLEGLKLWKD